MLPDERLSTMPNIPLPTMGAEVEEELDHAAAYAELLNNTWRNHECPASWESRNAYQHSK
jgi:hypothetical protein